MFATDFEYDGQYLGDYGFIICDFNHSSGAVNFNAGSKITFNKVAYHGGAKHSLVSSQYDECLQATFDICKSPDHFDDMEISNDEYRVIARWLNRREFHKFQLFESIYESNNCYFMASFNIEKIFVGGKLVGISLTMETDRPFAYSQQYYQNVRITDTSKFYIVRNISDELGYIVPDLKIVCKQSGDLTIWNETEKCSTVIKNCKSGEIITINGETQIIDTDFDSHDIINDFNFEFFRLGNSVDNIDNLIRSSLQCEIVITYIPVVKDAF